MFNSKNTGNRLESVPESAPAKEGKRDRFMRRTSIYLLPNFITTFALFAGFYALIQGLNGNIKGAAVAILVAVVLDAMDGRIARLTKSATSFGAEYDSLSDVIAFGVAPAIMVFSWGLSELGNLGWICAFIYTACTALRLARFNTQMHDQDGDFIGLASPAAAIIVATSIYTMESMSEFQAAPSQPGIALMAVMMVALGGLMVSNFRYWSPKRLSFRMKAPFFALVGYVMLFGLVAIDPPKVILFIAVVYSLSGIVQAVWHWFRPVRPVVVITPVVHTTEQSRPLNVVPKTSGGSKTGDSNAD